MAILIDPPMWPAHGSLWSHLVSDSDYEELHHFAARVPLPRRSFDLDHYDVPSHLYARVVDLGAHPVGARDVVHCLRESGLRVKHVDRDAARPVRRRQYLMAEWAALGALSGVGSSAREIDGWQHLGDTLIARWNEPHRRYHDELHLEDVLLALNQLATQGEQPSPATLLAAWFHDAVYQGVAGTDERESSQLALTELSAHTLDPSLVQQVGELIISTTPTLSHGEVSHPAALLLDADLSIFAAGDSRYRQYTHAVRAEYAHVSPEQFREGRAQILQSYLARPTIYFIATSQKLWEQRARTNLSLEVAELLSGTPPHQ